MQTLARWFTFASFFVLSLAACGGDDGAPGSEQAQTGMPMNACITLQGMPCACPGGRGSYGVYSCDGTQCLQCPTAQAGTGANPGAPAAAGGGQSGFAGRDGGRGMMTTPPATPPTTPPPAGIAGTGAAGVPSIPVAGAPGLPMGGAGRGPIPAAGSGGTGMAGTAGMPGGEPVTGEVPATPACMAASMWKPEWSAFEQEVLKLVNENRAKGWNCDTEGMKPAAGPLTMEPTLRCSARLHSKDMADRMFFAHDTPDGKNPGARMTAAGYMGRTWGENIAKGQTTPAQVVAGWMDSDGHCSNIMNGTFNLIGVGYYAGTSTNPRFNSELYWTQNFGATGGTRPRP